MRSMNAAVERCFQCHHTESVHERLVSLLVQTEEFKNELSRVFTLPADRRRVQEEKDRAYQLGVGLLGQVQTITEMTHPQLETRTREAFAEVRHTRIFLYALLVITPLLVLGLSIVFFRRFTRPVTELLAATRRLKGGDLDYRVPSLQDEYGEVAASFNDMASSLKDEYSKMQWAEQLFILGELSGGLAHEIKNPLAGVKASLEVLVTDSHIPEEDRDILQQSIEQIRRIEALLKNLLNFARPPKPQFMPMDMNGVLDATITLAQRLPLFKASDGRNIRIEKHLGHGDFGVIADPLQLQQVFMNLLINAGEAMPQGGTITVQTALDTTDSRLLITFTDTGQGIDPQLADKIFQPFYTTKAKGTGLGLSITKRLIEQHGGSIRAVNNSDRGVSFFITLPTQPREESAP
jgi:signal transduction histidine kinase